MWLAVSAAVAGADPTTIVVGLLALVSAVVVAVIGIRGTFRTADTARESAFDRRVDDRLDKSEQRLEATTARLEAMAERLEAVTTDRDRYREQYVELRLAVIARGIDPDDIIEKGAPGERG